MFPIWYLIYRRIYLCLKPKQHLKQKDSLRQLKEVRSLQNSSGLVLDSRRQTGREAEGGGSGRAIVWGLEWGAVSLSWENASLCVTSSGAVWHTETFATSSPCWELMTSVPSFISLFQEARWRQRGHGAHLCSEASAVSSCARLTPLPPGMSIGTHILPFRFWVSSFFSLVPRFESRITIFSK